MDILFTIKTSCYSISIIRTNSAVLTNIDENSKQIFETVEGIPKLEYTEKVLRAEMRLYPPAWTIGR